MRRGWVWLVLAAGCYAVPEKHQIGELDSGQEMASADDASEERDAEPDLDAGDGQEETQETGSGDGPQETQEEAGPRCHCTDPELPICIEATGLCVQCREEHDCAGGEHCLVTAGQCVGCLDASHCAGQPSASFCEPATNTCTGCRDGVDADCSNVPGLNVCQAGTCVQCAGARRGACGEATAACSTTSFTCEKCKADADCQRFSKVCNEGTGACVACTVDSETAQCNAKSCNPATHACTQTDRASVDLCGRCLADSECKADHRCIALNFQGASRGGHCMKRVSQGGCTEPFGATPIKRASLSGAVAEDYCGIVESSTSCEAVLALLSNRPCANGQAAQCGAEGAVCGNVNGLTLPRCSYACEASAECPMSIPCPVSGTGKYCGKI